MTETKSKYQAAFQAIRSYIITEGLQPGDRLPTEQQLSAELSVSRNVLREALKSMELMGMVQATAGRGTVVCPFSLDFVLQNVLFFRVGSDDQRVREMFELRKKLELSYLREVFLQMEKEDVKELRALTERMHSDLAKSGDISAADRDFHMTLFRRLDNSVLKSLFLAIWSVDEHFELEEKQPYFRESIEKHEAIVDALEDYDFYAFARAMEAHFDSGKYLKYPAKTI